MYDIDSCLLSSTAYAFPDPSRPPKGSLLPPRGRSHSSRRRRHLVVLLDHLSRHRRLVQDWTHVTDISKHVFTRARKGIDDARRVQVVVAVRVVRIYDESFAKRRGRSTRSNACALLHEHAVHLGKDLEPFTQLPSPPPLRHVGIYAYRAGFLTQFPQLPPAPMEQLESLEQLRALWHGHRIAVYTTGHAPGPGVDTPEDLERVRAAIRA